MNFVAVAVRNAVKAAADAGSSRCTSEYFKKFDWIVKQLDASVDYSDLAVGEAVSTDANLSSRVLRDVLDAVDIPYDQVVRQKGLLIDGSLLRHRNRIAHGERVEIDYVTYIQLHDLVIELMSQLKDAVLSRARDREYLSA